MANFRNIRIQRKKGPVLRAIGRFKRMSHTGVFKGVLAASGGIIDISPTVDPMLIGSALNSTERGLRRSGKRVAVQRTTCLETLAGIMEDVEVRRISTSSYHLRTDLGPLDGLISSISERGLIHPIIVRPTDDQFSLVTGMRRLKACKRLGWRKVPCHILRIDERGSFELALIENLQRKSMNPVEEARAFGRYVQDYGYGGVSELGKRIGKSEEYVSMRLRLLALPEDVLDKLTRRLITPSHAAELIGLDDSQQKEIADLIVDQRLSSRDVRRMTQPLKAVLHEAADSPFHLTDVSAKEVGRRKLSRMLDKSILLLKTTLISLDGLIGRMNDDDQWVVKETLIEHRNTLHNQIDCLIKLERKVGRESKN